MLDSAYSAHEMRGHYLMGSGTSKCAWSYTVTPIKEGDVFRHNCVFVLTGKINSKTQVVEKDFFLKTEKKYIGFDQTELYWFYIFELRDEEIYLKKIIAVEDATYALAKRNPEKFRPADMRTLISSITSAANKPTGSCRVPFLKRPGNVRARKQI